MSEQIQVPPSRRVIATFEEWRPSPWRTVGGLIRCETSALLNTQRRLLRGAAGGRPTAGQYRSTPEPPLTALAVATPPRGPFFTPVPQARRKGVPILATVVGVAVTAALAALCLGAAVTPELAHGLIIEALR